MTDNYDEIEDLWYSWLYSRLHLILAEQVLSAGGSRRVLDVGCGTGYQSLLHARAGDETIGIDVSTGLLQQAWQKRKTVHTAAGEVLFRPFFRFVDRRNERIGIEMATRSVLSRPREPQFMRADAVELPFKEGSFDHVNCCGSTLSLIDQYESAITEIVRVLKPGGTLFLEVESRWNLDSLWTILDRLMGGKLGLDTGKGEARRMLTTRPFAPLATRYPLSTKRGEVELKMHLFPFAGLQYLFRRHGLMVRKVWTVNALTNLFPSTMLDEPRPSARLRRAFATLARFEERIPLALPGCSIIVLATKG